MSLEHEFFVLPLDITNSIAESKITEAEIMEFYKHSRHSAVYIHDKYILPHLKAFSVIDTKDVLDDRVISMNGLNYYGTTIIMPGSLGKLFEIVNEIHPRDKFKELIALCIAADMQGTAILHYGI